MIPLTLKNFIESGSIFAQKNSNYQPMKGPTSLTKHVSVSEKTTSMRSQPWMLLFRKTMEDYIGKVLPISKKSAATHIFNIHQAEVSPSPEKNIVFFEELSNVCYNQVLSKVEATITINDTTGYNGNICAEGSTEYVRFFVDYGSGFENAGFSTVQVYDLIDLSRKTRSPQKHLVQHYFENENIKKASEKEIRVRAILSWNELPPNNPEWKPIFGNVCESVVLLKPREALIGELFDDIEFPKPFAFSYGY